MPATREARPERRPAADRERGLGRQRPARHAGSAVAAATTSSAISSEPPSSATPGAPVRGRAERVGLRGRQPPGDQRAGGEPERRRERGEHEVVGDEHAGHLRRREPDRAQQADLAARGEHAAADRGGEREAGGEQREQRRRLEDRQQPPRVVGELRALRAPVERAHAVALDAAGERLRGAGVAPAAARCRSGPGGRSVASPRTSAGSAQPPSLEPAVEPMPTTFSGRSPATIVAPRRDAVLARPAARQHDLARAADAAALEDQRVLDARARARETDQADAVGAAVDRHADDRARALGGDDAALPRDPPRASAVSDGDDGRRAAPLVASKRRS